MITDNVQHIINVLTKALSQPTIQLKKKNFSNLIILLRQQAQKIISEESILLKYDQIINNYVKQGMSRESSIMQGYQQGKIDLNISEEEKKLMQDILDGYQMVNKIREKLTGQKIVYQIGAGNKEKESILEDTLSYDELVPYLYIQHKVQGYAIRIRVSQTMLQDTYRQRQIQAGVAVDQIATLTVQGSTLYSAVYRYFTNRKLGKGGVGNWGNFYEVYRLLYHKSTKKNNYHPRESTIAKAFSSVLRGGGKAGSFAAGGDVLREQDKAGLGSNPSLTSAKTVFNVLNDLANNLQIYIKTNSTEAITNMLVRKNTGLKAEKVAYKEAIQSIKKALSVIPNTTLT